VSAEITVGSVLGGRYLVTAEVVGTAEGDLVFDGTDQVLNRPVSLLVAASTNATRVAVSAREIAMGTRPSDVQVLDLGLNADSTYLIANTIDAASLLDLVVEPDAPYIEPFQTDTLGQEIFGEPRSLEPQVYDDDAEYYQELAQEHQRRPRFGGLFGRRRDEQAENTQEGPAVPQAADDVPTPAAPTPVQDAGGAAPATGPFAAAPQAADDAASVAFAARVASDDAEGQGPALQGSGGRDTGDAATAPILPPVQDLGAVTEQVPAVQAPPAPTEAPGSRPAARFPREAVDSAGAGVAAGTSGGVPGDDVPASRQASSERVAAAADDVLARVPAQEPRQEGGDANRWTRAIVGVVLLVVLVGGVVFAVQSLTHRGDGTPAASASSSAPTTSPAPSTSDSSEAAASTPALVKPAVQDISLAAPGKGQIGNVYDPSLSSPGNAIDGKDSTRFATFSYTSPAFGGFYKSLSLRLDLEEASDVSSVTLSGLGGTGGEVQVLIGDTDSLDSAREVWSGSFSGGSLDVPTVNGGKPTKGQYVFVTITELPRLASPTSDSRPYGFQVSEIKVS